VSRSDKVNQKINEHNSINTEIKQEEKKKDEN
jgi:hypothetical protein